MFTAALFTIAKICEQPRCCHRLVCSMCVLAFVQETFLHTSPGDFERTFIKAWDSETKEVFRAAEAIRESLGCAVLWLPGNFIKKEAKLGLLLAHCQFRGKRGPLRQAQGVSLLLFLWLQVSWGPLEFRRKWKFHVPEGAWMCSREIHTQSLSWGFLSLFCRGESYGRVSADYSLTF